MKHFTLILSILLVMACNKENESSSNPCDQISDGEYLIYSDTDTMTNIQFFSTTNSFDTDGLRGYNFWFPAAPLSLSIENCDLIINEYTEVERVGMPSPGGHPRSYKESLTGYGNYFPENDSIFLYINYERTGDFTESFSGNLYLKKLF